jgi:hypothetical protein
MVGALISENLLPMKLHITYWHLLLLATLAVGCHAVAVSKSKKGNPQVHDAVLSQGEFVEFENPNGKGRIVYVSDFIRRYEIDGVSYNVKLIQRDRESLHRNGIYNPGESWGPISMKNAPRFVLDESILRFSTIEDAVKFFKLGHREFKWVFNKSGLALAYMETPGRHQINISLFKCYLNGKPMSTLPKQFHNPGFVRLRKMNP